MQREKRIHTHTRRTVLMTAVLAGTFAWGPASVAQDAADYPKKTVTLVVPYAPGSTDLYARLYAQFLTEELGREVVVENRAGAAGMVGARHVMNAPADGHTLLFHTTGLVTSQVLTPDAGFDVRKDFAPITLVSRGPHGIFINPSLPAKTVGELIAYAKANPGKLNYPSTGVGSLINLNMELLKSMTGMDIVHIPYQGGATLATAVATNQAQVLLTDLASVPSWVKEGSLKLLAVASAERSPLYPDAPTVVESGGPDFQAGVWMGFFAPSKTPSAVIEKLNGAIGRVLKKPKVVEFLAVQGHQTLALPPQEFAALLDREVDQWKEVVDKAKISTK